VFDIELQGKVVLKGFDVVEAAGSPNRAVVKEFSGIRAEDLLTLELVPKSANPTPDRAPIVNFIEVVREDAGKLAAASVENGL